MNIKKLVAILGLVAGISNLGNVKAAYGDFRTCVFDVMTSGGPWGIDETIQECAKLWL